MNDDRIKLGVLWKNVSQKGNKPYLSGRVQEENIDEAVGLLKRGGRLLILSNTKRPDKKDPDCVLYVVPDRSQAEAAQTPAPARAARRSNESPFP
ncbi:MAG TPA: hypothetical protein VMT89_01195 [Candidatus Acidoferrales bacterium]|nr:hypothetical protein [Candidatus Acidoferrales bacterium]